MPATPSHTSPDSTRPAAQARAPYNFVPLPQSVFPVAGGLPIDATGTGDGDSVRPWHLHGEFIPGTHSGFIDVEATALSPLFIRGATRRLRAPLPRMPETWDTRDPSRRPEPYTVGSGLPAIPAAAFRGMLRSVVEILSFSKITPVTNQRPMFRSVAMDRIGTAYRNRMNGTGNGPRAGFLRQTGNGGWAVEPAEYLRVPHAVLARFPDFRYFQRPNYRPAWTLQHQACWVLPDTNRSHLVADLSFEREAPSPEWKSAILVMSGSAQRKKAEFAFLTPDRPAPNPRQGRKASRRSPGTSPESAEAPADSTDQSDEPRPFIGGASAEAVTSQDSGDAPDITADHVPGNDETADPAPELTATRTANLIQIPAGVMEEFHSSSQLTPWQERAFPYWEPEFSDRERQDRAIERRRSDPGKARRRRIRQRHGHLRNGEPVFFLMDSDGKESGAQSVSFLGRARSFRIPYDRSPRDLVPDHLRDAPIDLAEAMFGTLRASYGRRPARAIASRVRVEDLVADPARQPNGGWTYPLMVPGILASPKTSAYNLLLAQGTDDPGMLATYLKGDRTVIRGHKVYWHRWNGDIHSITHPLSGELLDLLMPSRRSNDRRPARKPADQAASKAPESGDQASDSPSATDSENAAEPADTGHGPSRADGRAEEARRAAQKILSESTPTVMKPVKEGVVFRGRIRFDNLTSTELGALLAALNLPRGCAHRIGAGRPLGLGSLRTTATLTLTDREARYKSWEHAEHLSPSASEKIAAQSTAAFTDAMLSHAAESGEALFDQGDFEHTGLRRIGRLDSLFTVLSWDQRPAADATRYMEVEHRGQSPYATGHERGPVNEFRGRPVLPSAQFVAGRVEPEWTGPKPAAAPREKDLAASARPPRPRHRDGGRPERSGERLPLRGSDSPQDSRPPRFPRQPRERGSEPGRFGPPQRRDGGPDRPAFGGQRDSDRGRPPRGQPDRGFGRDRGPRRDPEDRLIPGLNVSYSTGKARNVQYKEFHKDDVVQGEILPEKTAKGAPKIRLQAKGKVWDVPIQSPANAAKPPEDLNPGEAVKVQVIAVNARSGEPAVAWSSRLEPDVPATPDVSSGSAQDESSPAEA